MDPDRDYYPPDSKQSMTDLLPESGWRMLRQGHRKQHLADSARGVALTAPEHASLQNKLHIERYKEVLAREEGCDVSRLSLLCNFGLARWHPLPCSSHCWRLLLVYLQPVYRLLRQLVM